MKSLRLGALSAALAAAVCLTVLADSAERQHGTDSDHPASSSRPATATEPWPKTFRETGSSDTPTTHRDGSHPLPRESEPTPDAADLTDEEAEAIRKATQ
jgi:hypothetical protein